MECFGVQRVTAGLSCMALVTREHTMSMIDRPDVCNTTWIALRSHYKNMVKRAQNDKVKSGFGGIASASACLDYREYYK